jgi:hypothetical protein
MYDGSENMHYFLLFRSPISQPCSLLGGLYELNWSGLIEVLVHGGLPILMDDGDVNLESASLSFRPGRQGC